MALVLFPSDCIFCWAFSSLCNDTSAISALQEVKTRCRQTMFPSGSRIQLCSLNSDASFPLLLSLLLYLNRRKSKGKKRSTDQMAFSNIVTNYIWPSVLNCGAFKLCYLFAGQGRLARRDERQTWLKTFLVLVAMLIQSIFFLFFLAVCRDFAVLEDHCLAHNLQEQESKGLWFVAIIRDYFRSSDVSKKSLYLPFHRNLCFSNLKDKQACVAAVRRRVTVSLSTGWFQQKKNSFHFLFLFCTIRLKVQSAASDPAAEVSLCRPWFSGTATSSAVQVAGTVSCAHHSTACITSNLCLHLLWGRVPIRLHCRLLQCVILFSCCCCTTESRFCDSQLWLLSEYLSGVLLLESFWEKHSQECLVFLLRWSPCWAGRTFVS